MSAPWLTGGRLSSRIVERHLAAALMRGAHEEAMARAASRCVRVWRAAGETLGPASGAGAVWAHLVRPCADALGWSPGDAREQVVSRLRMRTATAALGTARQVIVVLPWGTSQDGLQRAAIRLAAEEAATWVSVCNGVSWRWYDATRPYARDHLGVDLAQATVDARVWHVLWLFGQALPGGRTRHGPVHTGIGQLVAASASEVAGTAASLRDGVAAALAELSAAVPAAHDAHVTQIFQWLFLLFAEARGLLPEWQPAYRRSYALSAMARENRRRASPPMGVHESLVALARVGREGADLGAVRVAALNGPLFAGTPLTRRGSRLPDAVLGRILERLTHGGGPPPGRSDGATHAQGDDRPIDFATLGVQHLGSMYEHLMSPPVPAGTPALLRKRTGAFYTPVVLADLLVQRTLEPLVREASADQILSLRILDPAMGSGALLASALRYLVSTVETAWVREGRGGPLDIPADERASLPRRVAEQCLFGVDVDARAVQVARLSIWLLSLSPDRPLTWLDAHLRVGNSLVGASPALILSRAPVRERIGRPRAANQLTLFDLARWHHEASELGPLLRALSQRPTNSARDAHEKSRALDALRERSELALWRARADAWCGAAMDGEAPSTAAWRAVDERIRDGSHAGLQVEACRDRWDALARTQHCLHWTLEFPDVFDAGRGGFDAVIANPPWEMLRGDLGTGEERATRRDDVSPLLRFVRRSGVYREVGGHINSYQLFVERMLQLLRPYGRLGCLLPGSVLADHGAATLRRHVFDNAAVDRLSIFSNREALFPIHRSLRIVSLTATAGASTEGVIVDDGVAFRVRQANDEARPAPRLLSRAMLRLATGDAESIPCLRGAEDLRLLEHLLAAPELGENGWGLRFGRELNATEDRGLLGRAACDGGLVVVDGKHLHPFTVRVPDDGPWVHERDARTALPTEPWRRWRLAYRDISSPTNTRSLIAAILPPGCVSTHTLFCLRTRASLPTQLYLCGMLNSLVADWFVRRFLGAHVTTRLMARLPVPRPTPADPRWRRVVRLSARLMRAPADEHAQGELHVVAAELYGLGPEAMATVVSDFPRLPPAVRDRLSGW
jgi:hypothetical protein